MKDRPPVPLRIFRILLRRQAVGLQGCGDVPRVPPTFAARHCLQGCGDVPRVLPVDCTAPLRRLAQAQAQWMLMQLMKVRTPCTRAPYAMRVSHIHLRTRAHRPAHMCVCCTQRGQLWLRA